jgi:hypothetical protein
MVKLCGEYLSASINRRGAENAEVTQRKKIELGHELQFAGLICEPATNFLNCLPANIMKEDPAGDDIQA